jgi:adenylate cyclase
VDTVSGDALLATFGLPEPRGDDAERAAACAVALQLEVDAINERGRRARLPEVEIGVGVATGEVVVSGYGAGEGMRLKAVGPPLARALALEARAGGGEVWICDATRLQLGDLLHTDHERDVTLAAGERVRAHRLLGVGGSSLVSLRSVPPLSP